MSLACDTLYEDLMRLLDKPHDYNSLLAKLICDLSGSTAANTITVENGVPYFLDTVRNKYLSLARPLIQAADYGFGITNRFLKLGEVPAIGTQGLLLPRKATITALWAKSRTTSPWTIEVRKNGANVSIASLSIVAGSSSTSNIDIDVDEDDWIQLYANGTNIGFINATVELAWRKD